MIVRLGNRHAVEGYLELETGTTKYRPAPGERVTTFLLPEGTSLIAAVGTISAASGHLIEAAETFDWIEADDESLRQLLCTHLGVDPTAQRPADWGQDKEE